MWYQYLGFSDLSAASIACAARASERVMSFSSQSLPLKRCITFRIPELSGFQDIPRIQQAPLGSIFGAVCGGHIADFLAQQWPRRLRFGKKKRSCILSLFIGVFSSFVRRHGRILFGQASDFLKIWVLLVTFVPWKYQATSLIFLLSGEKYGRCFITKVITEPPRLRLATGVLRYKTKINKHDWPCVSKSAFIFLGRPTDYRIFFHRSGGFLTSLFSEFGFYVKLVFFRCALRRTRNKVGFEFHVWLLVDHVLCGSPGTQS